MPGRTGHDAAVSTPSQESTPTGGASPDLAKGGAAGTPADPGATGGGAPVQRKGAAKGPRSPSQDRRVSIGLGIVVLGVIAAALLVYVAKLDPLATALIVLVIGVVGGAVLGRPSRTGKA